MINLRYSIVLSAIVFIFLGISAQADPVETISLPFGLDNKDWEIGWSQDTPSMRMFEFVPKGQTVDNWKELVTLQFYPKLKNVQVAGFETTFIRELAAHEPQAQAKQISTSPEDVLFEWKVVNSKLNPDQFELDRIIKGKEGLHMIHYAVRTSALSDNEEKKWLNFLRSAKLQSKE